MLQTISRVSFFPAVVAALLLFAVANSLGGARPAYALTNCNVSDLTIDSEERAFLTLINNYRAANGKGALTVSVNLNRASSWMAVDMATKNYFSHTDSFGRSPSTRAQQCDFPGGAAENILAGTVWDTAQEAFDGWKNSPSHNSNMLNGSYVQIGIARYFRAGSTYSWYWVTNFSVVSDGTNALGGGSTPTPTPSPTPPPATSLTTSGSVAAGSNVTVNWSNIASPAARDWVGLFTPSGADGSYITWIYVSCSQTPTTAKASGSCSFAIPGSVTPGSYQLRLYANDGYTRLATANLNVTASTSPNISVSPGTVARGANATVTWSNMPSPAQRDWIGLYTTTANNTSYITWVYVSCSQTPTTGKASGSCSFAIPSSVTPGTYQMRFLANDGYTSIATSNNFTVN